MNKGEHKTTLVGETVFVLEGYFPPKDGTPGHWTTLYAWCFACGKERSGCMSDESRKRLTILKVKAQGFTGIPGALNLHHDGLAYVERADAHAAVAQIRKWNSCMYKVRVVRETVWKEVVIDDYPKESLERPFYWPPATSVPAGVLTDPAKDKTCQAKVQSYHDVLPRPCANRATRGEFCHVHSPRRTPRRGK